MICCVGVFACELLAIVMDLLLILLGLVSYLNFSSAFQLVILCSDSVFLN